MAEVFYNRGTVYAIKGQSDRAIQDFDQAIRLNPKDAAALNNRGNAYTMKGDNDRAIQDFDQAIRLNPGLDLAFNGRGRAYANKGDYDRAIQDFDQAIRLNPGLAHAFFNRGLAHYCLGRYEIAQKDFAAALQLQPKDLYGPLWLYLAQARGGNNALAELGKTVQRLDLKPWPGRVVEVYLGTAEPETVLSVAKDPDPQKDKNQLCEAYFYLAERALLAGNRDAAVGLLQQALQTEATQETVSYAAAKEELRRLNAQPKP